MSVKRKRHTIDIYRELMKYCGGISIDRGGGKELRELKIRTKEKLRETKTGKNTKQFYKQK